MIIASFALFKTIPDSQRIRKKQLQDDIAMRVYDSFSKDRVMLFEKCLELTTFLGVIGEFVPYLKTGVLTAERWEAFLNELDLAEKSFGKAFSQFWTDGATYMEIFPTIAQKHNEVTDKYREFDPLLMAFIHRMRMTPFSELNASMMREWEKTGQEFRVNYQKLFDMADRFTSYTLKTLVTPRITP